jgi:hypothetical protein
MSYFFRWRSLERGLPEGRERIAASNPYHDKLGQFSTAEDAVMFVRPRSGYHDGQMTADPAWQGAYKDGKLDAPVQSDAPKGFLANVLTAAQTPLSGPAVGLSTLAQQLASPTTDAGYPNPEVEEWRAAQAAAAVASNHSPSFSSVHDVVRDAVTKQGLGLGDLADKLRNSGFGAKHNGDHGTNASVIVTDPDGRKFLLKAVTDNYGLGAVGEELAPKMIKELGINVRVQEAAAVSSKLTTTSYSLTEWVDGSVPQDLNATAVRSAIDNTGREEVMKLIMFEALAGDSDKHRANYIISDDNKIVGMDFSRMGDYTTARGTGHGHQSVLLNTMDGTVSTKGMLEFLDKAYVSVERNVLPLVPPSAHDSSRRGDLYRSQGLRSVRTELNKRYHALRTVVTSAPTVEVSAIRDALMGPDGMGWAYRVPY